MRPRGPAMHLDNERFSLWSDLRRGDAPLAARLATSLISGLVLAALALVGAWVYAALPGNANARGGWFRVRDEYLGVSFSLAGLLWLAVLTWVWGGLRRERYAVRALIGTLGLGAFAIMLSVWLDTIRVPESEYLIAALLLSAAAGSAWFWLSAAVRSSRGRSIVTSDNLVNVNCPACGYSLVGLRELRCPECGADYTTDELIRAQNYSALKRSPLPSLRAVAQHVRGERNT